MGYEKVLASQYGNIESIRNHLSISGKGTSEVKQQLKKHMETVRKLEREMHDLKEGLEEIVRIYGIHESVLTKDASFIKYISGEIQDFFQDIKDGVVDKYEDWITQKKYNDESVTYRIDDKATREGFTEKYRETLQNIYDDVPGEYLVTRNLYDKYSEDVVVGDFYAVDEYGDVAAYHSNEKTVRQ